MSSQLFIGGDWGTSNLRLYLIEYEGDGQAVIRDERSGAGVAALESACEAELFRLIDPWLAEHGRLPVILSGMVGSTLGWHEVAYLDCPLQTREVAAGCLRFTARNVQISIVPGVRGANPLGVTDVMRGEELQVLGWQRQGGGDAQALLALPGTHNKWVLCRDNAIESFITTLAGETFDLLCRHSVLLSDRDTSDFDDSAFHDGLEYAASGDGPLLLHRLFATRSRQLAGELPAAAAPSFLSGLLIGTDVVDTLRLFGARLPGSPRVQIIGESRLSQCYAQALQRQGCEAALVDARAVGIAGLVTVFEHQLTEASGA